VFENRVLRRIFGPKWDEATEQWRKLHSVELHNLYSSPVTIRQIRSKRMRWAGHVARMGQERNVYKVLVGKPEGKRPLVRPKHRWEDEIKMDLSELGITNVKLSCKHSLLGLAPQHASTPWPDILWHVSFFVLE
jgi:hypothetical protein